MTNENENNDNKKRSEEILGMIRNRLQSEESDQIREGPKYFGSLPADTNRLKKMLTDLKSQGTISQEYKELPGYKIGYDEGYEKGVIDSFKDASDVLKAIEVLIRPHIFR